MDETLCPTDHNTCGYIADDQLNELLVRPLPAGATLHCCIDACHSGTVMDLCFRTKNDILHTHFSWKGKERCDKQSAGASLP